MKVMPPKEMLVQEFVEGMTVMSLSAHESVDFIFHVAARGGLRCHEKCGGSTLVTSE